MASWLLVEHQTPAGFDLKGLRQGAKEVDKHQNKQYLNFRRVANPELRETRCHPVLNELKDTPLHVLIQYKKMKQE